jgi:site-specific DNA-methyltransferase (adenine-specific)
MKTERLDLRLMDNMELMREFSDKHFDLAVVDPPYNQTFGKTFDYATGRNAENHKSRLAGISNVKVSGAMNSVPPVEYFEEVRRVSKHQIIWGANHMMEKINRDSPSWIIWDKQNGENGYADAELAFTSHDKAARLFRFRWAGMLQGDMANKEDRIHPTQKPVALYRWIFANYAKPGMRCLDTHLGSGSIAIAAHYAGVHLTACEIDPDYYAAACERIRRGTMQEDMFQPPPPTLQEVELPLDPSRL